MVTGGCFLGALFLVPLVAQIAAGVHVGDHVFYPVTAPALIVVGVLMARTVVRIDWSDPTEARTDILDARGNAGDVQHLARTGCGLREAMPA